MTTPSALAAFPPVSYSGKISSVTRLTQPSVGEDTLQFTNTIEAEATSYVWQPWFGNWRARGAISRAETDSEQDSTADFLTGDIVVNLFHRSHFPFSAFASVQDSRVELTDLSQATSDVRTLRLGLSQQYQDVANNIFYLGTFDHDEQDELTTGAKSVSDRLLLSADWNGEIHDLNGVLLLNELSSSIGQSDVTNGQGSFVHTYRPDHTLTVTTNGNLTSIDAGSFVQNLNTTIYGLSTQAEWRPDDTRLRVRGDASVVREETDIQNPLAGDTSEFVDTYRGRLSTRYEVNDEATLFAEVGVDQQASNVETQTTTFQLLSGTYVSQPIDWNEFVYTYTAGAGVGNRTDSLEGSDQSQSVNLGHSLTKVWNRDLFGPTALVFSAGQDGQFVNDTDDGTRTQIVHRVSLSGSQSRPAGTTYGQISAFDVRNLGEREGSLTSFTVTANHNASLSRYRSFDVLAFYNFNTSTNEGFRQETDVMSVELRYNDGRFFDVNRLTFESRLRGELTDLLAAGVEDSEGTDIEWDNRLDYRIGLLEVNTRAAYTLTDSNSNFIFLLGLTRRF